MTESSDVIDPLEAIRRHLDRTDDETLLVLRIHLLVEERLREILAGTCRSPQELPAARLSFYQVLCMCRAIIGRHDEPAWGFVARLNEIRNRMAHRLDPGDVSALVGSVLEKLDPAYNNQNDTPIKKLRQAALYACGYFDAIKGSVRLRQAYDAESTDAE